MAAAEPREGYVVAHRDELERNGEWRLVRRSLDVRSFGVNLVEIAPGGTIPEHDETGRDQEELFFVVAGSPMLVIDGAERPPWRARSRAWTRAIAARCATAARSRHQC